VSDIAIFPVGADGLPRVRALAYEIWPEAYASILSATQIPGMLAEIYSIETLRADMEERQHRYWLTTLHGADAGFLSAYSTDERVWIKKLYVLDAARGHGLGKRLLATAVEAFPAARSVGLYVNCGNAPAIAFYKAQGFSVEAEVPVRMGPYDFRDFVMSRPVARAD
jgi:ribosomal protein S18 acetylase RimI-like enzyme